MIPRDANPEGERKLDGRLRVLGSRDGNGHWPVNIPGGVTNAVKDWEAKAERAGGKVQNFAEEVGRERLTSPRWFSKENNRCGRVKGRFEVLASSRW
jgi:hypothetical protein